MQIERVDIDTLSLDPDNARKHDERNLEAIKGSLNKFAQVKPIVVRNNVIIAGNGTWAAAKKLNWETIDIVRVDHMSETEAKAYALADNKTAELAIWDDDVLNQTLDALLNDGFEIEDIGFDIDDIPGLGENENENTYDPDLPLAEEIKGTHNYIIIYFDDKKDFENIAKKLNISRAQCNPSPTQHKSFWIKGIGRGVDYNNIKDKV